MLMSENLSLLHQEEMYWLNRCHQNWLPKGDLNTNYFHKIAIGRKRENTFLTLQKFGEGIEGEENLLAHATECYSELYIWPAPEINLHMDEGIWEGTEHLSESEMVEMYFWRLCQKMEVAFFISFYIVFA